MMLEISVLVGLAMFTVFIILKSWTLKKQEDNEFDAMEKQPSDNYSKTTGRENVEAIVVRDTNKRLLGKIEGQRKEIDTLTRINKKLADRNDALEHELHSLRRSDWYRTRDMIDMNREIESARVREQNER